jgi:hypothetical protein
MSKIATVEEMIQDGWAVQTVGSVECFVKQCGASTMIAHNSRDGFTSHRAADVIIKTLGKPYKFHSFWDPKRKDYKNPRITTLEY